MIRDCVLDKAEIKIKVILMVRGTERGGKCVTGQLPSWIATGGEQNSPSLLFITNSFQCKQCDQAFSTDKALRSLEITKLYYYWRGTYSPCILFFLIFVVSQFGVLFGHFNTTSKG